MKPTSENIGNIAWEIQVENYLDNWPYRSWIFLILEVHGVMSATMTASFIPKIQETWKYKCIILQWHIHLVPMMEHVPNFFCFHVIFRSPLEMDGFRYPNSGTEFQSTSIHVHRNKRGRLVPPQKPRGFISPDKTKMFDSTIESRVLLRGWSRWKLKLFCENVAQMDSYFFLNNSIYRTTHR
jgi:hypothetical protein